MSCIRDEVRKGNDYFFNNTIQTARMIFRFRVDLIETKMNYKNKYIHGNLLCDSCESEVDLNTHVLYCPAYKDLRAEKDLQNDNHLALYLQKVMAIRAKLSLAR